MNVLAEELITDVEAREILKKREEEKKLNYEQKNALDHLRKFATADYEKIMKAKEELRKLNLRERQIVAILNFLPTDKDDIRAVFQKEYSNLSEEEINKILEIVKGI